MKWLAAIYVIPQELVSSCSYSISLLVKDLIRRKYKMSNRRKFLVVMASTASLGVLSSIGRGILNPSHA